MTKHNYCVFLAVLSVQYRLVILTAAVFFVGKQQVATRCFYIFVSFILGKEISNRIEQCYHMRGKPV